MLTISQQRTVLSVRWSGKLEPNSVAAGLKCSACGACGSCRKSLDSRRFAVALIRNERGVEYSIPLCEDCGKKAESTLDTMTVKPENLGILKGFRMDMIRCSKCATFHYGNDPCPYPSEPEYIRFDAESYCVVHLRPNSDVVQMCSNIANETCAKRYAQQVELDGGHVFASVKAGVLVAALLLIKKEKR